MSLPPAAADLLKLVLLLLCIGALDALDAIVRARKVKR